MRAHRSPAGPRDPRQQPVRFLRPNARAHRPLPAPAPRIRPRPHQLALSPTRCIGASEKTDAARRSSRVLPASSPPCRAARSAAFVAADLCESGWGSSLSLSLWPRVCWCVYVFIVESSAGRRSSSPVAHNPARARGGRDCVPNRLRGRGSSLSLSLWPRVCMTYQWLAAGISYH